MNNYASYWCDAVVSFVMKPPKLSPTNIPSNRLIIILCSQALMAVWITNFTLLLGSLLLPPFLPSSLLSGLWSMLSVGLLVVGDDALCNLHATFEGLCYCDLRLPLLVRPRRQEGGREGGREGG